MTYVKYFSILTNLEPIDINQFPFEKIETHLVTRCFVYTAGKKKSKKELAAVVGFEPTSFPTYCRDEIPGSSILQIGTGVRRRRTVVCYFFSSEPTLRLRRIEADPPCTMISRKRFVP